MYTCSSVIIYADQKRDGEGKKLYSKPEICVIEINFFAVRLEQRELSEQNENYKATTKKNTTHIYERVRGDKQTLNLLYNSQKLNKNSIGFYTCIRTRAHTLLVQRISGH